MKTLHAIVVGLAVAGLAAGGCAEKPGKKKNDKKADAKKKNDKKADAKKDEKEAGK